MRELLRFSLEQSGLIERIIFYLEKIPAPIGMLGFGLFFVGTIGWMLYKISVHNHKNSFHRKHEKKLLVRIFYSGNWVFPLLPFAIRGMFDMDQEAMKVLGILWIPTVIALSWWMFFAEEKDKEASRRL
ncbi:MAG TPA: hypothetical protein VI873_04445 [Candidatus Peribacteraceae bacterium]|nr:hypothetical protein [Candidatus Peribacteraceae bacterium]